MTPAERAALDKLDAQILNASDDELKKIQEIDVATQLDCIVFDTHVHSHFPSAQNLKQSPQRS